MHPDPDPDLEYRKAMAKYSASFMSNAKWLSFFRAIILAGIPIERAEWRFIDSTHSIWEPFPSERDLLPTRFADGRFQPFEYRWIESIYIPSSFKPTEGVGYERHQDTEAVVSTLARTGQFLVEKPANGITLYAYLRESAA
jgi:hypothetical protein